MRLLLVCYGVGLLLGGLSLIEWLVSRLARLWLVALGVGCIILGVFTERRRNG